MSTDRHPLVLIDPADAEQVETLLKRYHVESDATAVERMQAALRSLATPPTPEPTGLGAVVRDSEGAVWIRHRRDPGRLGPPAHWSADDGLPSTRKPWGDIPQPVTVLAEGWSE